jgi:hypothetical protein
MPATLFAFELQAEEKRRRGCPSFILIPGIHIFDHLII